MLVSERYDVIVIGGGVAGLSTAANITEGNVLLLEKNRIRTEEKRYLRFTFMDSVERLRLLDCIIERYDKILFQTPTNRLDVEYNNFEFVIIDLGKLHKKLMKYLTKKQEINEKWKVTAVKNRNKMIEVKVSHEGAIEKIFAKYLVDASGNSFFTKKIFNLPYPNLVCHCCEAMFRGGYIGDPNTITFIGPSTKFKFGGWIYPIDKGNYLFGLTNNLNFFNLPLQSLDTKFKQVKYDLRLADKIEGGVIYDSNMGLIPVGISYPVIFGRICYVGDTVSQATPWMLEGVRPSLDASIMCADAINEALKQQEESLLEKYKEYWNFTYGAVYNAINLMWKWDRTDEEWSNSFKRMSKIAQMNKKQFLRLLKYDKMSEKAEERLANLKSTLGK
jgi:flavin-dependent dehydrogenase